MKFRNISSYRGPNRRSDMTLVEILFEYADADLEIVARGRTAAAKHVRATLDGLGVAQPEVGFPGDADTPIEWFSRACAWLGLALQKATGHRVKHQDLLPEPERGRMAVLFEHEESQVGEQAGKMAVHLLAEAFPQLQWNRLPLSPDRTFAEYYRDYEKIAAGLVQPLDTEAIVRAARRANVPVVKLERDPYDPVKGDFRIRMNSMLMLGHSPHRQVTDGTLALEQARFDTKLAYLRVPVLQLLKAEGLPVPRHQHYPQPLISPRRARRIREALGGRVVVKSGRRAGGRGVSLNPETDRDLSRVSDEVSRLGGGTLFQAFVPGDTYRLLFANGDLIAALGPGDSDHGPGDIHPATLDRLAELAGKLNVALALFTLVSADIAGPLDAPGSAVIDLEVAPELDRLFADHPDRIDAAAEALVAWLFPPGSESRIPITAVTGTNGKTTTTRMINHVLKNAGRRPGMVCTEGVYIGEERTEQEDLSNLAGHFRVFESREVDCAVVEANHKGLAAFGLSFRRCEVAVVTNVTEDHLGDWGVDTIEDMTAVKRSLPERGRAVVLNADDPQCVSMLPQLEPEKLVLTSLEKSSRELRELDPRVTACFVLAERDGADWIEMHDEDGVTALLPAAEIPVTFGGAARFNISNALQCAAACHLLGIETDRIVSALRAFQPDLATTPGRLNLFDELPFRVLVDFAHNPDGFKRLTEFVDTLEVTGRKVIALSASGNRSDAFAERIAAACAGHYDDYLCKDYAGLRGREADEIPELLKHTLIQLGVDSDRVHVLRDHENRFQDALAFCREDDLLVLIMGNNEFWTADQEIARFKAGTGLGIRSASAAPDQQDT